MTKRGIYKLLRLLNLRFIRPLLLGVRSHGMEYSCSVYERHYEYPFSIDKIMSFQGVKEILDIGCAGSHFPLFLASIGYNVIGIDINNWEVKHRNFNMIVSDIKNCGLQNNSFDLITAISTIEHVGLYAYNEKPYSRGDLKAMKEIHRILRDPGHLILSVPYGKYQIYNKMTRIYDNKEFDNLCKDFVILDQKFYGPINRPKLFRECSERETYSVDPYLIGDSCVTCVVLRKKEVRFHAKN